ncbi:hypothetical protein [Azomonas macrocytogenes]|uniref:Uncharacterized protein n=1 Tax=Azomonas macrocytogenes TaxID=69962 RepID=A0A839T5F4_AZOMA|nr:hypothetical protein [Azomonas macrocytogenes]MBB3104757.1 hypothetical protein [Azomonas macrocytogenes]
MTGTPAVPWMKSVLHRQDTDYLIVANLSTKSFSSILSECLPGLWPLPLQHSPELGAIALAIAMVSIRSLRLAY